MTRDFNPILAFVKGLGDLASFCPDPPQPTQAPDPSRLRADWLKVGRDFNKAIETVARECLPKIPGKAKNSRYLTGEEVARRNRAMVMAVLEAAKSGRKVNVRISPMALNYGQPLKKKITAKYRQS